MSHIVKYLHGIKNEKNKDKGKHEQNLISEGVFEGSDLKDRINQVVNDVALRTGFKPQKLLGKSSWWGSTEIGAFHYLGSFQGKNAVLKVQGVKPKTSEIYMINSFAKQNRSSIIRPPYLFATLPWDDKRRYEALIMENVGNQRVVNVPTNNKEVERFFELFKEYRQNCRNRPWIKKPEITLALATRRNFDKWRKASYKIYPDHPLRKPEDEKLIDKALSVLERGYKDVDWDFQHAHLSDGDFYIVGNQVVVLSNLYWSWRAPFYDAIFGYHWFMYHLASAEGISPQEIEEQRSLWLNSIKNLPETQGKENQRLLKLALLERAAAGLNLDALSIDDPQKPIAEYLVTRTREILQQLIEDVENTT